MCDNNNKKIVARALLDSGSTVNLITEKFAKLLNLPKQSCSISVGAVDGLHTRSKHFITTNFHSKYNETQQRLQFLIVPNIADAVPNEVFPRHTFNIPHSLKLADPQFHLPKPVDVLLSSSTTLAVLSVGQIKLFSAQLKIVLQKTTLGWIVAGGTEDFISSVQHCNVIKLDKLIERFWRIEDFDHEPIKSHDEVICEQHYNTYVQRDDTGRYIVRLPFRDNQFDLGQSRSQALKRFYILQKRFAANDKLKVEYTKVMDEYLSMGHMTLCDDNEDGYYLPHHAVIKESSETTKVRVVFDASAKTTTGISLNDTLMVGPTIQNTIFEQILKFRIHRYVVTADIAKMYRQILIHPEDRKFQKIFWFHDGKIKAFQLNTVTFGTAAAPFLAIRTMHQLARDEAHDFPLASKLLQRDFYVDDFVSGANSIEEILTIQKEMISLLRRGGFLIRQWASNHESILNNIDKKFFDLDCMIKEGTIQKTLGITWNSQDDVLQYTLKHVNPQVVATKRNLLSELSKIFDPLGLLGPVILYAKLLIQECWKAKISWDESLPQHIYTKWKLLAEQLPNLKEISIPRQILIANPVKIDIHGFCDASNHGYGACLFIRSIDSLGHIVIKLVCSKSRVAPLNGITIPRLELCAASILKKLYCESISQFEFTVDKVTLWSDSMIVLCWLKKAPHLLRTFESNRVADIQSLGERVNWRHVSSKDNPADALSRGQLPNEFVNNSLWNSGPPWLLLPEVKWPTSLETLPCEIPGLKKQTCLFTVTTCKEIYSRFSKFEKFVRVIAYMLRWRKSSIEKDSILSVEELRESEVYILRMIQREQFSHEFKRLSTAKDTLPNEITVPFRKSTRFDEWHPFIDDKGLIRVGGRLKKSQLPYNQKHPILLPSKHPVTDMIIRQAHEHNLHAGIQTTLHFLRQKFWILNGKNQIRNIIRRCVECIKQKPIKIHAQMADLPAVRVTESPGFTHTGVDFFGPILTKEKKYKNRSFIKSYGCVFVCLASKAVHIELAVDLSTEGFLSAFKRFTNRKCVPEHMYSDNGTNFVGANKELQQLYDLHNSPEFQQSIKNYAVSNRITWHFNPPLSPHFGGLWEAAVKSFKHHLKRVMKGQSLTYEQTETLLIEIEAVLNSRPLYTQSADPNDPLAITPSYLLNGRTLKILPEKSFLSVPDNRLSTYNFITKAKQDFWQKWHKEYLNELQVRQKWHESTEKLTVGSIVILIDDANSCSQWPLGVITEIFPGSDGIARVATVKTANGIYKRNITRLCVLPVVKED